MLRIRELSKEALEQFAREAEWVLARRRKADEAAREVAAEEKRRWLERLRRDEATLLTQKGGAAKPAGARVRVPGDAGGGGGGHGPSMRLLLPDLGTEAGPSAAGSVPTMEEGSSKGPRPVDPAMQSLMQNITQMTGLGLLPPPAQAWGDQQNPEHVAELISTMKTLMRKYESGAAGNRPSPLLPPPVPAPAPQKKPPMLLTLTKRRRLLGDLLPDAEMDEGPEGKRPRAGLGLLPHPGEAGPTTRRTLLGQAPAPPPAPGPRKTLLGEKPEGGGPPAGSSYNKKVLFPTGPSKAAEDADSASSECLTPLDLCC